MRALRLALGLAFALAGCTPDGLATDPRATLDPGSSGSTGFTTGHTGGSLSSATVGSSSGGAATSSGSIGGTSAGSSGGSGSGGTTGNCPQTGPAPTLQCQRSDGSTRWLMTKESVHLDCTLTGAEETPTWSGSVAPGFFSVDVRNAPAVITVGLGEATLPTTFGDTQVQVTLTATPQLRELKDNFGNVHRLGVLRHDEERRRDRRRLRRELPEQMRSDGRLHGRRGLQERRVRHDVAHVLRAELRRRREERRRDRRRLRRRSFAHVPGHEALRDG